MNFTIFFRIKIKSKELLYHRKIVFFSPYLEEFVSQIITIAFKINMKNFMNLWSLMLLATHICEQHSSVKVRLPLSCFFPSSSPTLSTSLVYFFAGSSCSSRVLCVFWRQLLTFTLSQCFTGSLFFTSSLQHNFSGPKFFISLSLWWLTCSIGFFLSE